jgi:F0F1-type ATP synthase assembly protein I
MVDDDAQSPAPARSFGGRDLLGLGGLLVGGVVGGLVVGLLVDHWAGTSPLFVLVGIALGIVLTAVGFWSRVRDALRQ